MLKIKIDTALVKSLNPCRGAYENWLKHHADFSGDILEALALPNILVEHKIWVCVRVLPRELVEVFAIDCAVAAADAAAAAAAAAAYAAAATYYAAAYAAAATYYAAAAAAAAERERQLGALAYLVRTWNPKDFKVSGK